MNKKFTGYFWALYNYQKTAKARHDIKDYLRALILIGLVIFLIWSLLAQLL
jgi:hypothetical protein